MDRNFYYQTMAKQREREISNMWAHPREPGQRLSKQQARRLVFRLAFAVLVLSVIVISVF